MSHSTKGSRYERRAKKLLESKGYYVMKSGGSRGAFDLIAANNQTVKFIQVKAGVARVSPSERLIIENILFPPYCTKEIWTWKEYQKEPNIEIVN